MCFGPLACNAQRGLSSIVPQLSRLKQSNKEGHQREQKLPPGALRVMEKVASGGASGGACTPRRHKPRGVDTAVLSNIHISTTRGTTSAQPLPIQSRFGSLLTHLVEFVDRCVHAQTGQQGFRPGAEPNKTFNSTQHKPEPRTRERTHNNAGQVKSKTTEGEGRGGGTGE